MNTITIHAINSEELEINSHCFDYLEGFNANDIADSVMRAKKGFTTPSKGKLPTIFISIKGIVYGAVVSTKKIVKAYILR